MAFQCSTVGFFHDFGDDDVSFRVRRAGYEPYLAGDTWVVMTITIQSAAQNGRRPLKNSIEIGRANFRKKYFDVEGMGGCK